MLVLLLALGAIGVGAYAPLREVSALSAFEF